MAWAQAAANADYMYMYECTYGIPWDAPKLAHSSISSKCRFHTTIHTLYGSALSLSLCLYYI